MSREIDIKILCVQFYIKLIVLNRSYSTNTQPYYVTRTSANGSLVYWSRDFPLYHLTMIVTAIGLSSGDVIRTIRTKCNYIINYIY